MFGYWAACQLSDVSDIGKEIRGRFIDILAMPSLSIMAELLADRMEFRRLLIEHQHLCIFQRVFRYGLSSVISYIIANWPAGKEALLELCGNTGTVGMSLIPVLMFGPLTEICDYGTSYLNIMSKFENTEC